jgi:voltage-dependent potassium channel beta subunit
MLAVEYRRLGASGLKVSALGLGTWLTFGDRLDDRTAFALVRRALDLGINLFDTADVYEFGRAEQQLGRALAGVPRKDYLLASKCFFPTGPLPNDKGLSRKHVFESVHASLQRLGVEYLDLFFCHRHDPETPLPETVRAIDDLIRQGRILYWGVSCWTAAQTRDAVHTAARLGAAPPIASQPAYSLISRGIEAEVMPACRDLGIGILSYSPLGQGVLTGKYTGGELPSGSRGADDRRNRFMGPYLEAAKLHRVEKLAALAIDAGATPSQLAIAWVLRHPEVAGVINGATQVPQLEENVRAATLRIDDALFAALDRLFAP